MSGYLPSQRRSMLKVHAFLLRTLRNDKVRHPNSCHVFGHSVDLDQDNLSPIIPREVLESPSLPKLLPMFAALHGCVQVNFDSNRSYVRPAFSISKSVFYAEILFLMSHFYGGSIARHGTHFSRLLQPMSIWCLYGQNTIEACREFSRLQSPAQDRLDVLGSLHSWPRSKAEKMRVMERLRRTTWNSQKFLSLKDRNDIGAFFDAAGTIFLDGVQMNRIEVLLSCPSQNEFDQLTEFFKAELGSNLPVSRASRSESFSWKSRWGWRISSDRSARDVLSVLEPRVVLSKRKIEVALSTSESREDNITRWRQVTHQTLFSAPRFDNVYSFLSRRMRTIADLGRHRPERQELLVILDALRQRRGFRKLEVEIQYMKELLRVSGK